jgi:hypothetical protein
LSGGRMGQNGQLAAATHQLVSSQDLFISGHLIPA